ncbi:MAG: helix-turn-helix domain-containing protein [Phycisphaerales bacterium]
MSKTARAALGAVTGKRARIVVEHILKHGSVTTDDLRDKYGYGHPPRAKQDLQEQGIPVVTTFVKAKNGRRMAAYSFCDLDGITAGRVGGRASFPKAFKQALVAKYGSRCALCNAQFEARYLQIDHRIPYLVAGDRAAASRDAKDFMLVCGSCNRAKSWSCEHCPNGLEAKDQKVCAVCYWANPLNYTHVATADIRRLDVTWTGSEVSDFDAAKVRVGTVDGAMPKFVKDAVRRALREKQSSP